MYINHINLGTNKQVFATWGELDCPTFKEIICYILRN